MRIARAFKNNYGSICPSSLCNTITGMLTVNADPHVRDKTSLWAPDMINTERITHGWEPFDCPRIEEAAADPCALDASLLHDRSGGGRPPAGGRPIPYLK